MHQNRGPPKPRYAVPTPPQYHHHYQQQADLALSPDFNDEENELQDYIETSLVCTIPEHHKLEDIVHQNREQISNLKNYIHGIKLSSNMDDIALLEKKAEIEALDLAINDRKSQLLNMELAKNRRLYEKRSCSTATSTAATDASNDRSRNHNPSQMSSEVCLIFLRFSFFDKLIFKLISFFIKGRLSAMSEERRVL
jgi:hypothetical protein